MNDEWPDPLCIVLYTRFLRNILRTRKSTVIGNVDLRRGCFLHDCDNDERGGMDGMDVEQLTQGSNMGLDSRNDERPD
jgi:hypothetical protein